MSMSVQVKRAVVHFPRLSFAIIARLLWDLACWGVRFLWKAWKFARAVHRVLCFLDAKGIDLATRILKVIDELTFNLERLGRKVLGEWFDKIEEFIDALQVPSCARPATAEAVVRFARAVHRRVAGPHANRRLQAKTA
jgi:hypothetical protein